MAIQQPLGTDNLNSPDHSLSHRVFANDDAATVQSVVVDSGNNVTLLGSLGLTGTRVSKGWFTDLEATNAIAGSVTGNAATVTGLTLNSEALTLNTGALTLTPNVDDSSVLTIGAGAVGVSGSNTGDNAANSSTHYIGTTEVALNRASAALTLAGITLTTPDIGTPSAGTLTSCSGLPAAGVVNTAVTLSDAQTVTGVKTLGTTGAIKLGSAVTDKCDIQLNNAALNDETWSGTVVAATLGATIAVGDVVYLQTSDSRWELVDGILDGTDVGFKLKLGICLVAGNDGSATKILLDGLVASAAFPAFTVGAPVYLDDTAGDLVVAQPSTTNFAIRVVGEAVSATVLHFHPSNDYIVHI